MSFPDTQTYKLCGDKGTVDTICAILKVEKRLIHRLTMK